MNMAADDGFGEDTAAGTGGAASAARFRLPAHAASTPIAAIPAQMSAKQMPCAMVNCSPKKATASTSAMVGLTYWMKPITVSEMRLAAAERLPSCGDAAGCYSVARRCEAAAPRTGRSLHL